MIAADDPRHGTTAGHNAGCRLDCCRAAKLRYDKRRKWEVRCGRSRLVSTLGTRRRIRALQAIGHAFPHIGEVAGVSPKTISDLCYRSKRISPTIARAIAEAYEQLCMTPSTSRYARRSRLAAQRKGWAPPLAWDDIDDPAEMPKGLDGTSASVDPAVVERILSGDWHLNANRAERYAVLDTFDGTDAELERRTRWNVPRLRRERGLVPVEVAA